MLRSIRERIQVQKGFTLVELLVVTTIIGMLAAMGLPAFLGEEAKGHDASAKSNARNVVAAVESCYTDTDSYEECDTALELERTDSKTGVGLTDSHTRQQGTVSITATDNTFSVASYSQSENTFVIEKAADGTATRSCTTGGTGGCRSGDVW